MLVVEKQWFCTDRNCDSFVYLYLTVFLLVFFYLMLYQTQTNWVCCHNSIALSYSLYEITHSPNTLLTVVLWISFWLTHRVTHICVSKLTTIDSDNGLSPDRRQAIIWTNAGILWIGPLGRSFSEILIKIETFSFKEMRLKMSSEKWRPFYLDLNVLTPMRETHMCVVNIMEEADLYCEDLSEWFRHFSLQCCIYSIPLYWLIIVRLDSTKSCI